MTGQRGKEKSLRDLLPDDVSVTVLRAGSKESAIVELLNTLVICGRIDLSREKQVLEAILEREKVASTGIGNEFALPHVKTKFADRLGVAIGLSPQGIDFGARDGVPARFILLAVCPSTSTQEHLSLMRGFASLAKEEGDAHRFLEARDRKAMIELLAGIAVV